MDEVRRFVGIDVAKAALDVFIGSGGAWSSPLQVSQLRVSVCRMKGARKVGT